MNIAETGERIYVNGTKIEEILEVGIESPALYVILLEEVSKGSFRTNLLSNIVLTFKGDTEKLGVKCIACTCANCESALSESSKGNEGSNCYKNDFFHDLKY